MRKNKNLKTRQCDANATNRICVCLLDIKLTTYNNKNKRRQNKEQKKEKEEKEEKEENRATIQQLRVDKKAGSAKIREAE
jgi:hypothetical protein